MNWEVVITDNSEMVTIMSSMDNLMGILTFNKEQMGEIVNDEGATIPAILIVLITSFISFISRYLAFLELNPEDFLSSDLYEHAQYTYLINAFAALFLQILILFFFAGIMGFVLRRFGGTVTLIQSLRLFGFCQIFATMGSLIELGFSFLDMSIGNSISFILVLVGLVSFIVGLTSFSGLNISSTTFAVIIAYILAFITGALVTAIIVLFLLFFLAGTLIGT